MGILISKKFLVGNPGLEPGTSRSQTECSSQLSQFPKLLYLWYSAWWPNLFNLRNWLEALTSALYCARLWRDPIEPVPETLWKILYWTFVSILKILLKGNPNTVSLVIDFGCDMFYNQGNYEYLFFSQLTGAGNLIVTSCFLIKLFVKIIGFFQKIWWLFCFSIFVTFTPNIL